MKSNKWNMTDNIYAVRLSMGTIGLNHSEIKNKGLSVGDVVMVHNYSREMINYHGMRSKVISIAGNMVEVSAGHFIHIKFIRKKVNGTYTGDKHLW